MSNKKGLVLRRAILNETQQESWPERDELPTGDPIGDVDETWKKDMKAYFDSMRDRVIVPSKKDFDTLVYEKFDTEKHVMKNPTCNCGTFAVYGKVPADAHRPYCALRKDLSSSV